MAATIESKRLLAEKGLVTMRLYGQGLGDCFLLAFPRRDDPEANKKYANPDVCYLVIDCGAAMSTPDRATRMKQIVTDIRDATNGHVDALVITHQHFDHVSGFQDAWKEWNQIHVETLYLPWTESDADTGELSPKQFREALERAAAKALQTAAENGILDTRPGFRAQADFLGVDVGAHNNASANGPKGMDQMMQFARDLCHGNVRYFEPGDVFRLPGTDSHGYVLGPPRNDNVRKTENGQQKYIELLVDDDAKIMYSYNSLNMHVDAGKPGGSNAFALSDDHSMPALTSALLAADVPLDASNRGGDEPFSPFAPEIRLDWDQAMSSRFFRHHYGGEDGLIETIGGAAAENHKVAMDTPTEGKGENGEWRRVDLDWLAGTANLTLRAGSYTNNISMVLAFDIPGSEKMLLFPGDAQVGNWLSWHTIRAWRLLDDAAPASPPAVSDQQTLMQNLLSRVAFYKVGHHGSHNATIKEQGLEMMTRDDLVAYIPVSVPVAQDLMGYCPMPFYPVLRALQVRTQGRVFLPNGQALLPLPIGKTNEALLADSHISCSAQTLPPKQVANVQGEMVEVEGEVPLYLELAIAAE